MRAARSLLRSERQQLLHSSGTAALQRQESSIPAHTQAATAQTQGALHALVAHADVPTSPQCMLLRVWCTLQPPLTRISAMPTCLPHRQAAACRSRRTHGRRVLELLLGDGDIAATAVLHQAGSSAPVIEVFQDGQCVYREVGGRVFKSSTASAAAAPIAEASAAGAARATGDAAGSGGGSGGSRRRATHRALLGRTPLVKHLDWLALRGTGGECPHKISKD